MIYKTVLKSFIFCFLLFSLSLTVVYGSPISTYLDPIRYNSNMNQSLFVEKMIKEIDFTKTNSLEYSFFIDLKEDIKLSYLSNFQNYVLEILDGVLENTPSIKMSYNKDKITIKLSFISEKDLSYLSFLDSFVLSNSSTVSDYDKLLLFSRYLYINNFVYCDSYSSKYPNMSSSNLVDIPICRSDSVFLNKEGICIGYSNLLSDYCKKLNIPTVRLRGIDKKSGVPHSWNLVYIDYKGVLDWYCLDSLYSLSNKSFVFTLTDYMQKGIIWDTSNMRTIIRLKYSFLEPTYLDIRNHWSKDSILSLSGKGLVSGYSDNTFKPNDFILISEFLKMSLSYFLDTRPTSSVPWWYDSYIFALNTNIIDNSLIPLGSLNTYITREYMAYILHNINTILLYNSEIRNLGSFLFLDDSSISSDLKSSVYQVYLSNLMLGKNSKGIFDPSGLATRGEAVVVVNRLLRSITNE